MEGVIKMGFDNETVNNVYEKTDGYYYYCGKKLSFKNYDKIGNYDVWGIEHNNPKASTNYLRNLVPTCISYNRDKSAGDPGYKKIEPKIIDGWFTQQLGLSNGFIRSSRKKVDMR